MAYRDRVLARFGPSGDAGPLFVPDLTLWHKRHLRRQTLPAKWPDHSLAGAARAMGTPAWTVLRPWRVERPGVEVRVHEADGVRTVRYLTPAGEMLERWSLGPDGDWWQTEYPVKILQDWPVALAAVAARKYVLDAPVLEAGQAAVSDAGVVALEIPMRPYSDVLHTLVGWGEGLMLMRGEGQETVDEILRLLESQLRALTAEVAALPGDLLLAPDNLDGQYVSPRVYRAQFAVSYAATAEAAHASGKPLLVHAGGTVKRLLPLLAESGVDGVEGVAGPPQGDATLAEARAAAPGLTLWGGIPQDYLLAMRSQAEFETAVAEAVAQARGDGRIILGVADRVPTEALLERLEALAALNGMA